MRRRLARLQPFLPAGPLIGGLVAVVLLIVGEAAPAVWPVRVAIDVRGNQITLDLDGSQHTLTRAVDGWTGVRLEAPGPEQREVQIDGSDTVGREDRDAAYIRAIASTPLYAITSWLRDDSSFSRWDQARLIDLQTGAVIATGVQAVGSAPLPRDFLVEASLRHPEAIAHIWLTRGASQGEREGLELDRNQRQARWVREPAGGSEAAHWFFPEQPLPFAANLLQLLGRSVALGYGLLLGLMLAGRLLTRWSVPLTVADRVGVRLARPASVVLGGLLVGGSAAITVGLYHQLPHILDASEYYLQAGMFATGHLWFEPPPLARDFANYSQVVWEHRWFSHYPPGAAAAYAFGRLLGLAWLVGPLAALAMVGGTAIAARTWFGPRSGLVTLGLGALSPFVLFQAGSFLSHPIAGAALGGALAAFARGDISLRRWPWQFGVVGLLLGAAFLTREMSCALFAAPLVGWLVLHRRWRALTLVGLALVPCLVAYLAYNNALTRDPLLLPRLTADTADHPGFGDVGQFGRHTLAAGLVNADQDLNALQLDLFGWPPLVAFGLMALPFVLGRVRKYDLLLAAGAVLFIGGYIGFFAHGIGALGPRFYYEGLPWFILLTVRGLQVALATATAWRVSAVAARGVAALMLGLLSVYAYAFYMPRLVERRVDYAALNGTHRYSYPFVTTSLSGPRLQGFSGPTVVLVPDEGIYKTLSALNCPQLDAQHVNDCPVLFMHAGEGDVGQVLEAYPGRTVLKAEPKGQIVALAPVSPVVARR